MDGPRRSIVREHLFEDSLRDLIPSAPEADDFVAAAESVLSYEPEIGTPNGEGMWLLPMAPLANRDVWLFYTFDESTVTFVFIGAF